MPIEIEMTDISYETFGKYVTCTMYDGLWYADADFPLDGTSMPEDGAIPDPQKHPGAKPFERPTIRNRARRLLKLLSPKSSHEARNHHAGKNQRHNSLVAVMRAKTEIPHAGEGRQSSSPAPLENLGHIPVSLLRILASNDEAREIGVCKP